MTKARLVDLLTLAIFVVAIGYTLASFDALPERMPVHFDAVGRPNGWTSREVGAWFTLSVGAAIAIVLRMSIVLLPVQVRATKTNAMRMTALAIATIFGAMQVLLLRAAVAPDHQMGGAIWLVVFFAVFGIPFGMWLLARQGGER